MRIDIHTVPGVVTLRADSGAVLYSAPSVIALKHKVSTVIAGDGSGLGHAPITNEFGKLQMLKEWCKI